MDNSHHEKLFQFLQKLVPLNGDDRLQISAIISHNKYQKGDQIIRENQISSAIQFVVSGVYRVYQLKNGKEITSYFNYNLRNQFVAAFVSFLTQQPSKEYIECIVPGETLSINYSDLQLLYQTNQRINSFGRLMAEFNYVLAMERIESLQIHSATDRYEAFLDHYPNLLNLIPHHYVASYLGITPESLSRIRKK